jgi:neurotrimin
VREESAMIALPAGKPVTLRCTVEAHPMAVTYWVRGNPGQGEQILMNNQAYQSGANESASGPSWRRIVWLTIESFEPEDEGVYRCIAANSHGKSEGFMRLHSEFIILKRLKDSTMLNSFLNKF